MQLVTSVSEQNIAYIFKAQHFTSPYHQFSHSVVPKHLSLEADAY
jgi:hypothetical protein